MPIPVGILLHKSGSSDATDRMFSILIPSWNNLPYLKLCIESIQERSRFKHQIIVHVNEGTDGTLDWIISQNLSYSYSRQNIGICYALNAARSLAQTDYIMYMNDDMYVCPDWDAPLVDEIRSIGHNRFFLSSTLIEPYLSNNPCVIVKDFGADHPTFNKSQLIEQYAALKKDDWQGATWPPNVVHVTTWDLVGGYSIEFSPGMGSDPDFSMKLWKMGVRYFKGLGASRVYHFGCKSTGRTTRNDGNFTFFQKWGITSGTFTKYYLHRGEQFDGLPGEPTLPFSLALKNLIKRIKYLFR